MAAPDRERFIKRNPLDHLEAGHAVAKLAAVPQLAVMDVVLSMANGARAGGPLDEEWPDMALHAFHVAMFFNEGIAGLLHMLKGRPLPIARVMTKLAFLPEGPFMIIVFLMTIVTT